jgi:glycosyltransferase involved in cell wall biosynthesis
MTISLGEPERRAPGAAVEPAAGPVRMKVHGTPAAEPDRRGGHSLLPSKAPLKHLVVIPAYNEEACLAGTIASLQVLPECYDVVVVDDGSRDRTREVAERAAAETGRCLWVVRLPINGGIGAAVQTGYLFARDRGGYEYVIQCDADGQHDPGDIPKLVDECRRRGLDLCIGSRFLERNSTGDRSTFMRRVGITLFTSLIGLLSGVRLTDPTSGFRCTGPRAWRRFAESYPEDYPEPESAFWCVRNRLVVGEVGVCMRPRAGGISSIRYWRAAYYVVKVSLAILIDRLRSKGN